ncbi:MAG: hypothetical protein COY58_05645 [Gammaproteobacteria bacterium CG_4_10_14_0_8_um_filter_38_16]|nr:MAG: hypothetical protein COY58_05645 [Gammaproteobacteria bacterium CG_4_10_14_0_8_um_filter_38_16]PJA04375.1 MAG: hypothetical protein COX72_00255 [Gammaproteobacteria bacterium CG_4_10_14_0_2_um_filter_38_22]
MLLFIFALICIWISFSGWLFFMLLISVLVLTAYSLFYARSTICALLFSKEREWILYLSHDQVVRATLLGDSVMFRHIMILHFQLLSSKHKKSIVLFSDQFSIAVYRELRRCIKMGYF